MRFLSGHNPQFDLTYDDVFLTPSASKVRSRFDVDLQPSDGTPSTIPLVVANMTAISGRRMAETVARRGGLAILPQDLPQDQVIRSIQVVKQRHTLLETAVTVLEDDTVHTVLSLIDKRAHGAAVVLRDRKPVGVVTRNDCLGVDQFTAVSRVMSGNPTCLELSNLQGPEQMKQAFEMLDANRRRFTPVIDDDGELAGVLTRLSVVRSSIYRPAVDTDGNLAVGVAIGINSNVDERAAAMHAAGADVLVIDTAHGHQEKMIHALKQARAAAPHAVIAAGNVVTAQGVEDLIQSGADIVKVGVGPGAMCTTRMMTAVGRPQFSAVHACAQRARALGKHVWADGGVRYPRDVALAIAAGASQVMIGSWFAGTYESPGDLHATPEGQLYKENFGMASARAVAARTEAEEAFQQARKALFEEGISTSKMFLDPERPGVEDLIDHITAGLRSSCTYAGAQNLEQFYEQALVGVQSTAGYQEGRPLPTSWA